MRVIFVFIKFFERERKFLKYMIANTTLPVNVLNVRKCKRERI